MAQLTLVSGPSTEPVSLSEAKDHVRVDFSNDDSMINSQITAARQYCEEVTGRAFLEQTWRWTRDRFPAETFDVPKPELMGVNSISYTREDGTTGTVPASDYIVDTDSTPGRVSLTNSTNWPSPDPPLQRIAGWEMEFDAGYGSSLNDVQDGILEKWRRAILLVVGHLYENREWTITGSTSRAVKRSVESLLANERVVLQSGFKGSTYRQ